MNLSFKNGVISGTLAGVIWGWISMLVNSLSGAFPFEHSTMHNLVIFSISGAIFGIIVAGFLVLIEHRLPLKGFLPKAISVSTFLWVLLRLGGMALTIVNPERYLSNVPQTIQGLFLSITLGLIMNFLWNKRLCESTNRFAA